ncbi:SWIM zinc finger family protein [Paenibacillus abyssi]|uniref:SWIM-type domain-containing protein n=1 Tax=Paenibacillus abyssi TaxID=1340531 RepID=A0A917CZR2_9BACL|nr:SWIM zinc finger family protein [Paenibacillus abyssi]GGG05973.1 hypothetical protein GCM10010916_23740 [Paenibacillus abyssi]
MKQRYTLNDAQWDILLQDVALNFDDLTIKRGFNYYKQGRVHQFTMPDPGQIEAIVEGNEPYRVGINLDSFGVSHCTCPFENGCKHMIAVLLDYTEQQGRSVHALVNAKVTANPKQAYKPAPGHVPGRPVIQRVETGNEAKIKERAVYIQSMQISEWHELFELITAPLANNTRNTRYASDALISIDRAKSPLTPALEQLFELHARLYVLGTLATQPQNQLYTSEAFWGYHTLIAASELQEDIRQRLDRELKITTDSEHWHRVAETLAYLRGHMLGKSKFNNFFYNSYEQLWRNWICPTLSGAEFYLEELQQLTFAEAELGASLQRSSLILAQCWMHFYLFNDQEAWTLLNGTRNINAFQPDSVLPFLSALSDAEDWPRLLAWLVELDPLLGNLRNDSLDEYFVYWETAAGHLPGANQPMWDALIRRLPFSRSQYEQKLLAHGKWQQWIDYQLSRGSEPLDYRVSVLQPMEKHAPEMLLPFYHQAVERYILNKNRDSYKSAVKLLKRLAKLYTKMKQEARWELFIAALTDRNSRLRALQEELRKGKLIP